MSHLVEEHSAVDPTYVEDFLLTYRTFLKSPIEVADKLLKWFTDSQLRDRVSSYKFCIRFIVKFCLSCMFYVQVLFIYKRV